MTTGELLAALRAEPEGTEWWKRLCKEAHGRAKFGSLHPRHVPESYDPAMSVLPAEGLDLEDAS